MADTSQNERQQKKTETKKPEAEKKTEKVIYLGPPMMERSADKQVSFSINYGTIYSNGIPEDIAKRIKDDPNFAKLFKPVVDAPKAMKELMNKDSDLSAAHKSVSKDYKDRKKARR